MKQFAAVLAFLCLAALAARAQDPVQLRPDMYKVEIENDQVRVVRAKRAPHSTVPMHDHPAYVVIYLTDVHQRVTMPDGTTQEVTRKAGQVTYNGPTRHAEENLSDQPFEALLIELKTKPAGTQPDGK